MSAPADALHPEAAPSSLDRPLAVAGAGRLTLAWAVVLAAAVALRLSRLDLWALAADEARQAFAAWLLYTGAPTPVDVVRPTAAPLLELLEALAFFLFGVTDATFRLPAALAGVGIVALPLLLRPWAGRLGGLGMALWPPSRRRCSSPRGVATAIPWQRSWRWRSSLPCSTSARLAPTAPRSRADRSPRLPPCRAPGDRTGGAPRRARARGRRRHRRRGGSRRTGLTGARAAAGSA
jgi:hypothetical protein